MIGFQTIWGKSSDNVVTTLRKLAPIYDEITGEARVSEFTNYGIVSKIQYVAPPTSDPNISVIEPTAIFVHHIIQEPDSIGVG